MDMIPKVVPIADLEGGVIEEPLTEAKLPEGWVPPKVTIGIV